MIEVNGLCKRFGATEVLRGVTLSVAAGEVAAIIGSSGGGKSTFLRCLNGLESFEAGAVAIDGIGFDAASSGPGHDEIFGRVCRRVGMVFQSFNLFAHQTVLENLVEAPIHVLRLPRAAAEDRACRLLERVGLRDRQAAMPCELSGGQQQRVAIARALAMEPRAVLFDEPTSALDPRMTAEVLAVMTDLAHDGLTMLVVTHAMRFARQAAHTVHVFGDGRIIESGPPERIFEAPHEEATRLLLAQVQAA